MAFDLHPDFRGFVIAAFIFTTASFGTASAESATYRFEAELAHAHIIPPEDSVAAAALAKRRLSGTFGFESDAPRAAEASNPVWSRSVPTTLGSSCLMS
jgi:hypothetical protein